MAFTKYYMNEMFGTVLVLSALLSTVSAVDCQGKSFHCVNSTHFMICVDLGGAVSQSIDDFFIPCPPPTVCQLTNHFECEFPAPTTLSTTLTETTPPWEEVVTATSPPGNATKEFSEKYVYTERITTVPEDSFTTDATADFTTTTTPEIYNNNELKITETLSTIAEENATAAIEIVTQPAIQNINLTETVPAKVSASEEPTTIPIETVTLVTENVNVTETVPALTEVIPTTGIEAVINITTENKNPIEIFITEAPTTTAIETVPQSTIKNIYVTVSKPDTAEEIPASITETVTQVIDVERNITASKPVAFAEVITTPVVEMVTQPIKTIHVTETVPIESKKIATTAKTVEQSRIENINLTLSNPITAEETTAVVTETVTHIIVENKKVTATDQVTVAKELTTPVVEMVTQPIKTINVTETVPIEGKKIATTAKTVEQSTIENINITVSNAITAEEKTTVVTETVTHTIVQNKNVTATDQVTLAEELTTPVVEMVTQPIEYMYVTETVPTEENNIATTIIETVTQSAIEQMNATVLKPVTAAEVATTATEMATHTIAKSTNVTASEPVLVAEELTTPDLEIIAQPTVYIIATETVPTEGAKIVTTARTATKSTIENTDVTVSNPVTAEETTAVVTETVTHTIVENKNVIATDQVTLAEELTTSVLEMVTQPTKTINVTETVSIEGKKIATTAKTVEQSTIENINLTVSKPVTAEETTAAVTVENKNVTADDQVTVAEELTTPAEEMVTQPIEYMYVTETVPTEEINIATTIIETVTQSTSEQMNGTVIKPVTAAEVATTATEMATHTISENTNVTATELVIVAEELTTPDLEMIAQPTVNIIATETVPTEGEKIATTAKTATKSTIENTDLTVSNPVTAEEATAEEATAVITETVTHTIVENKKVTATDLVTLTEELTISVLEMVTQPTKTINVTETVPIEGKNIATTAKTVEQSTIENINLTVSKPVTAAKTTAAVTETVTHPIVENKNVTANDQVTVAEELTTRVVETVTQPTENFYLTETVPTPITKNATTVIQTETNTFADKGNLSEPESVVIVENLTTIVIETTTQPTINHFNVTQTTSVTDEGIAPTIIERVIKENKNETATVPVVLEEQTTTIEMRFQTVTEKNYVTETSDTPYNLIVTITNTTTEKRHVKNTGPIVTAEEITLTTTEMLAQTTTEPTIYTKEHLTTTVGDTTDSILPSLDIREKIQHLVSKTTSQPSNIAENYVDQQSLTTFQASIVTTQLPNTDIEQIKTSQLIHTTTDYTTDNNVVNEKTDSLMTETQSPVGAIQDGALTNSASTEKPIAIYEENLTRDTTLNLATIEAIIPTTRTVYLNSETTEAVSTPSITNRDQSTSTAFDLNRASESTLYATTTTENISNSGGSQSSFGASTSNDIMTINRSPDNNVNSVSETKNQPTTLYISVSQDSTTLKTDFIAGNGMNNIWILPTVIPTEANVAETTVLDGVYNIYKTIGTFFNTASESQAKGSVEKTTTTLPPPESKVVEVNISVTPESKSVPTNVYNDLPAQIVIHQSKLGTSSPATSKTIGVEIDTEEIKVNEEVAFTNVPLPELTSTSQLDTVIVTESNNVVTLNPTFGVSDLATVSVDGSPNFNIEVTASDGVHDRIPISGSTSSNFQTEFADRVSDVRNDLKPADPTISYQSGIIDGASDVATVSVAEAPNLNTQTGIGEEFSEVTKVHAVGGPTFNSQSGISSHGTSHIAVNKVGTPNFNAQTEITDKLGDVPKVGGSIVDSQLKINDPSLASNIVAVPITVASTKQTGVVDRSSDVSKIHVVGGPTDKSQSEINGVSDITEVPVVAVSTSNQPEAIDRSSDVLKKNPLGDLIINSQTGISDGISDIVALPVEASTFKPQTVGANKSISVTKVHTVGSTTINSQTENIVRTNDDTTGQTVVDPTVDSQSVNIVRTNDNAAGHTVVDPTVDSLSVNIARTNDNAAGHKVGGLTVDSQTGNVVTTNNDITDQTGVDSIISKSQTSAHNIPQNSSLNFRTASPKFNSSAVIQNFTESSTMPTEQSQQNNSYAKVTVPNNKQIQKTNTSYTTTVQPPTKTVAPNQITAVTNNHNDTSTTYNCIKGIRGRYSDKDDCRKFYICYGNNQPIVGNCPENTVFSDLKKLCTKNMSHCIRDNEFKCPSAGRFSDFVNDNVYYICVSHKNHLYRFKFQCQKGYFLNKETVKCLETKEIESNESVSISSSDSSSQSSSSGTSGSSTSKNSSTTNGRSNSSGSSRASNSNSSANENSSSSSSKTSNSSKDKSSKSKESKESPEKSEDSSNRSASENSNSSKDKSSKSKESKESPEKPEENSDSSASENSNSSSKDKSSKRKKSKEAPENPEEKEEDEEEVEVFKCEKEGKFPVHNDCRRYYLCKKKRSQFRRKIKKCESGDVFHKSKKKCVDADSYEC